MLEERDVTIGSASSFVGSMQTGREPVSRQMRSFNLAAHVV
jgi:hypothetical protein